MPSNSQRLFVFAALSTSLSFLSAQTPLGPAFTYQGQIQQNGQPLAGPTADLEFRLFDDPNAGNQIGNLVSLPGHPVWEGLFTALLNANGEFGPDAFNGQARWLQISVNGQPLAARQLLTAAPYALYALNGSGGYWSANGNDIYNNNAGYVGIGTPDPQSSLHVLNSASLARVRIESTDAGPGGDADIDLRAAGNKRFVVGWDADLNGTGAFRIYNGTLSENALVIADATSNIGIGTTTPVYPLHVQASTVVPIYAETDQGFSAVYGLNEAPDGRGIAGVTVGTGGTSYGVWGQIYDSTSGAGVYGLASALTGITYGGHFTSNSSDGVGARGIGEACGLKGLTLQSASSGRAVSGQALAPYGTTYGGHFESASAAGTGVCGVATAASGTTFGGYFEASSPDGTGIYAVNSNGLGKGVQGLSAAGTGVRGESSAGMGVHGVSWVGTGVTGEASWGIGVAGSTELGTAVAGSSQSSGTGVSGASSSGYGGHFTSESSVGVAGTSSSGYGGRFTSEFSNGLWAETSNIYAVGGRFEAPATAVYAVSDYDSWSQANAPATIHARNLGGGDLNGGHAIRGTNTATSQIANTWVFAGAGLWGDDGATGSAIGVLGTSDSGSGVWGVTYAGAAVAGVALGGGLAGYFEGDVDVWGTLYKSGGSFKIDHPLDPENKFLLHSFVESPDMMNVYNGNITTDERGYATVELPDWFEVLNRDFRYQLTIIDTTDADTFAQAKVVRQIENNQFTIRSSAPRVTVSWQVTGIRHDPWAKAHRIPVEQDKNEDERGEYLHPAVYGQPREMRIGHGAVIRPVEAAQDAGSATAAE